MFTLNEPNDYTRGWNRFHVEDIVRILKRAYEGYDEEEYTKRAEDYYENWGAVLEDEKAYAPNTYAGYTGRIVKASKEIVCSNGEVSLFDIWEKECPLDDRVRFLKEIGTARENSATPIGLPDSALREAAKEKEFLYTLDYEQLETLAILWFG